MYAMRCGVVRVVLMLCSLLSSCEVIVVAVLQLQCCCVAVIVGGCSCCVLRLWYLLCYRCNSTLVLYFTVCLCDVL